MRRLLPIVLSLGLIGCNSILKNHETVSAKSAIQINTEAQNELNRERTIKWGYEFYYMYGNCVMEYLRNHPDSDMSRERKIADAEEYNKTGKDQVLTGRILRLHQWAPWMAGFLPPKDYTMDRELSQVELHCNNKLMPKKMDDAIIIGGVLRQFHMNV